MKNAKLKKRHTLGLLLPSVVYLYIITVDRIKENQKKHTWGASRAPVSLCWL